MIVRVMKLHPSAKIPTRAHATDAGMDLYALEDAMVIPGQVTKCKTGIAIECIDDTDAPGLSVTARILPKSGLALSGIDTMAGVVDAGYRGDVTVVLTTHASSPVKITAGSKIAQLVIVPVLVPERIEEVESLSKTSRGEGGFGSTGK